MADAADLKSVVRKDVRVRLPPSAPTIVLAFWYDFLFSNRPSFAPLPVDCHPVGTPGRSFSKPRLETSATLPETQSELFDPKRRARFVH